MKSTDATSDAIRHRTAAASSDSVSPLLRALRDAEAEVEVPARVEARVLAAWDAAHRASGLDQDADVPPEAAAWLAAARRARPGGGRTHAWQQAGAMAAAAALAFTLTQLGGKLRTEVAPPTAGGSTMVLVGEPILQGEPVRLVRMRIPASTLSALGLRSIAGDLGDAVDVDVIVGEDGVARAIRVGM
jgi:hypothetical protein